MTSSDGSPTAIGNGWAQSVDDLPTPAGPGVDQRQPVEESRPMKKRHVTVVRDHRTDAQ